MKRTLGPHALQSLEWNGERGAERAWTATCACGWMESHSTKLGAKKEHAEHQFQERLAARSKPCPDGDGAEPCNYTPDVEYDPQDPPLNCERCGGYPEKAKTDSGG